MIPKQTRPGLQDFADLMENKGKRYRFMLAAMEEVLAAQMRALRSKVPVAALYQHIGDQITTRLPRDELVKKLYALEVTGSCGLTGQEMLRLAHLFGIGLRLEFCRFEDMIVARRRVRDREVGAEITPTTKEELRAWLAANPDT